MRFCQNDDPKHCFWIIDIDCIMQFDIKCYIMSQADISAYILNNRFYTNKSYNHKCMFGFYLHNKKYKYIKPIMRIGTGNEIQRQSEQVNPQIKRNCAVTRQTASSIIVKSDASFSRIPMSPKPRQRTRKKKTMSNIA